MFSLSGAISNALSALQAQQGALNVTSNNISNVNTPGYSLQRAVFIETTPISDGSLQFGTGVTLEGIQSIRDKMLQLQLDQEGQQEGKLSAYSSAMSQVEALFNETGGVGLEGYLSNFFSSLQNLSTNPTSMPLRQQVITSAQNLAGAFHQSASNLDSLQGSVDLTVSQSVNNINGLTQQVAALNQQITGLVGTGQEPGSLVDQRDQLVRQLSGLVGLNVIDAGNTSVTLTTSGGSALVVGNQAIDLQTQIDPATGFQHIVYQGSDITWSIDGGQLGGLLQARDVSIPQVKTDLDTLASSLANAFNAAHKAGFDLNGVAGGDFFVPPPASGAGAAASFAVALTDPTLLAASSDGSPGSNGNLSALSALQNQKIVAGQSPEDFYSNFIAQIGNNVQQTNTDLQAEGLLKTQLENQRGAVSGVSLDEEAANLLRFQQAYQAAARVVTVVDNLTQNVLNIGYGWSSL